MGGGLSCEAVLYILFLLFFGAIVGVVLFEFRAGVRKYFNFENHGSLYDRAQHPQRGKLHFLAQQQCKVPSRHLFNVSRRNILYFPCDSATLSYFPECAEKSCHPEHNVQPPNLRLAAYQSAGFTLHLARFQLVSAAAGTFGYLPVLFTEA